MEIPVLRDFIVLFCLASAVLFVCHNLRIPVIVGFLVTGVISGPYALGLVRDTNAVEVVSKLGLILLLFTIGVEFSLKRVLLYKQYFILGGSLQVALTIISGFFVAKILGRPFGESLFLGFLLSLSSTAIVLRIFESRFEAATSHARLASAILIFQDLMVIPMMLFIPALSGVQMDIGGYVWFLFLKGALLVLLVILLATKIIPKLFYYIAETHIRELFLLSVLVICFSVATLSEWMGLSISIGAFLAGLIISESEYSYQAIGDIIPFQDVFTSLFFISIGMLLDIQFLLSNFPLIIITVCLVMFLKWSLVTVSGVLIGVPLRAVLLTAFAICQIGEFSFVLAKAGLEAGIGTSFYYQLFLAIAILSMGITPFLIHGSHHLVEQLLRLPIPLRYILGRHSVKHGEDSVAKDHVIIIGFGVSGKNLATSCKKARIDYRIADMNAKTVHRERKCGEPIIYGDASHEVILKKLHIQNARALSIAINDPVASIRIIQLARRLNPAVYILCRTHYLEESKMMFNKGANEVIPDELGSSIEMFSRVLQYYRVPQEEIENLVLATQEACYEELRR